MRKSLLSLSVVLVAGAASFTTPVLAMDLDPEGGLPTSSPAAKIPDQGPAVVPQDPKKRVVLRKKTGERSWRTTYEMAIDFSKEAAEREDKGDAACISLRELCAYNLRQAFADQFINLGHGMFATDVLFNILNRPGYIVSRETILPGRSLFE